MEEYFPFTLLVGRYIETDAGNVTVVLVLRKITH